MKTALTLSLLAVAASAAAQTTMPVGLFQTGPNALRVLDIAVSCGPAIFPENAPGVVNGPMVGIVRATDKALCVGAMGPLVAGVPAGAYQVAVRTGTAWGERSLPFNVPAPAAPSTPGQPKTCTDAGTVYALGTGPAFERHELTSTSSERALLTRERALVTAGFVVAFVPLSAREVGLVVTCR